MNIDDLIAELQKLREQVGPNATTNVTGVRLETKRDHDWDITIGVTRDSI